MVRKFEFSRWNIAKIQIYFFGAKIQICFFWQSKLLKSRFCTYGFHGRENSNTIFYMFLLFRAKNLLHYKNFWSFLARKKLQKQFLCVCKCCDKFPNKSNFRTKLRLLSQCVRVSYWARAFENTGISLSFYNKTTDTYCISF